MTITDLAALLGAITGPLGLLLAALVYYRDRAKVIVDLRWGMKVTEGGPYDPEADYGLVKVTNVGRRPVFVSHVHLKLPRGPDLDVPALILSDGIAGMTLKEGAPPMHCAINQETMTDFADHWAGIRAAAIEGNGKHHYSAWPTEAPQWAESVKASWARIRWNMLKNRLWQFAP